MRGAYLVALTATLAFNSGCDRSEAAQEDRAESAVPADVESAREPPSGPAIALGALVRSTVDEAAATAEAFVPPAATAVAGFDVAKLLQHRVLIRGLEKLVSKNLDADDRQDYDDLAECGIDFRAIRQAVLATDTDHMALTIQGPRVGDPSVYRCFEGRVKARGNPDEFEMTTTGRYTRLSLEDGDAGFLIGAQTLVIVQKEWIPLITEELDAPTRRLHRPGEALAALIDKSDTDAASWWAATLDARELGMPGIGEIESLRGHIVLADRLETTVWLGATSDAAAEKTRAEFQEQFDSMKGILPTVGLTGELVESVSISAEADSVRVSFQISDDDIKAMESTLGASL